MKKADYKSVERHLVFSSLSRKIKKQIKKERSDVKKKPSRERRSWEYMYNCWLGYAAANPDRKNQVPIAQAKLSSWVHEQRKKFMRAVLSEDRFFLLSRAGFDFQPRKSSKNAMKALLSAAGKSLQMTSLIKPNITKPMYHKKPYLLIILTQIKVKLPGAHQGRKSQQKRKKMQLIHRRKRPR